MIKKTTEKDGTDGNRHRSYGKGREQAGISREPRRTSEEDMVYDRVVIIPGTAKESIVVLLFYDNIRGFLGIVRGLLSIISITMEYPAETINI